MKVPRRSTDWRPAGRTKRTRRLLGLALLMVTMALIAGLVNHSTSAVQPLSDNCGFLWFTPSEPNGYQHFTATDCSKAVAETFSYPIAGITPALTITAANGRFAWWGDWIYGTTTYSANNQACGTQTITVSFSRPVLSVRLQPSTFGAGPGYGSNSLTITTSGGDSTQVQKAPADNNFPPTSLTAPFPGTAITSVMITANDGLSFTLGNVGYLLPENDCYPVKSLEMVAINSPLDTNPNIGGGQRVFPDKLTASDNADRKRVRIKAYTASGANKTIYFKSFDLDDPSSSTSPVDPNDSSGPTGNDNRGIPSSGVMSLAGGSGSSNTISVVTDSNGIAQADLSLSMQPGDNFMVAASADQTYLNAITIDGISLREGGTYGSQLLPTYRGQVTAMLTVWRRVHIEMDSMGLVSGNKATGKTSTVVPHAATNTTDITASTTLEINRFENGRITLNNVGTFSVLSNSANMITVQGLINSVPHNTSYTMYDDDDFNNNNGTNLVGDNGENVTAPDISLLQDSDNPAVNAFAVAYVRPKYDVGDYNDLVSFKLNTNTTSPANIIGSYDFDAKASEADNSFWTVYLLGAYQAWTDEDGDPNTDNLTLGIVDNINGQGANVFNELLRSPETTITTYVNNAATSAHEIGHLFNGQHGDLGLMEQSSTRSSTIFTEITLNRIRSINHP
jgi:hypothetical protein